MDMTEQFRQYMLAGHGRAFSLLKGNEEQLRATVLYGCLHDISYDLQCEGSRGIYMYNLALQYEEPAYFLHHAITEFMHEKINTDWHIVSHLCDFIGAFAEDGDKAADAAILQKYAQLYTQLMSMRMSRKAMRVLECYEYLAICMLQQGDTERAVQVCRDVGAYFLRRRRTDAQELLWLFHSFSYYLKDGPDGKQLMELLTEKSRTSKELRRFLMIMQTKKEKPERPPATIPTAEELICPAGEEMPDRQKLRRFRLSEETEKIKLAEKLLCEPDPEKKANLLYSFQSRYNPFPLSPEPLIQYAQSENETLREAAREALCYVRAECVHTYARQLIQEDRSVQALEMLLCNFRNEDETLLLDSISDIEIDRKNRSGWHDLVLAILNAEPEEGIPDALFWFIYEKSLCACCRAQAFKQLQERGLLTEVIRSEAMMDCEEDIRAAAREEGTNADTT